MSYVMTSRERLLAALDGKVPDRLPATTHHLMPYFLDKYMNGMSEREFFDALGLDAIRWINAYQPSECDSWRIVVEDIPGQEYETRRHRFVTPKGELTMVLQSNQYTSWISEHLVKHKQDIELIAEYAPAPRCDVAAVNAAAAAFGQRGIIRGHICTFDVFGQPGAWQDAACLVGIQDLILAAYDDAAWVHELLGILQRRKLGYIQSLAGAAYDLLELGGGDASCTVISPQFFDEFVAPYDAPLITAAHGVGQRIVYHTCGGMMAILERIAGMKPDAMETFTPKDMGGDANLAEAKRRIGGQVCMIGGLDQLHFFTGCTAERTRAEVRRCFAEAGEGGGFILSPSDHFFDAAPALVAAFADEARRCVYGQEP
jgi:uroporphyrinogen decarboxylase